MDVHKIVPPTTFGKQEGAGLLGNYYQEDTSVEGALQKRRQKLAEDKLHLQPDADDPGILAAGKSSL